MDTTTGISSSFGPHPLRFMALKNICSEGYTHFGSSSLLLVVVAAVSVSSRGLVVAEPSEPLAFSWCPGVKSPRGIVERTREVGRSTFCPGPRRWFGGGIMLSLVAGVRTVAVVVEGVEGVAVVSEDLLSSVLTGFIPPKRGCVARKCSGTGHLDMMWHRRVMDGVRLKIIFFFNLGAVKCCVLDASMLRIIPEESFFIL